VRTWTLKICRTLILLRRDDWAYGLKGFFHWIKWKGFRWNPTHGCMRKSRCGIFARLHWTPHSQGLCVWRLMYFPSYFFVAHSGEGARVGQLWLWGFWEFVKTIFCSFIALLLCHVVRWIEGHQHPTEAQKLLYELQQPAARFTPQTCSTCFPCGHHIFATSNGWSQYILPVLTPTRTAEVRILVTTPK